MTSNHPLAAVAALVALALAVAPRPASAVDLHVPIEYESIKEALGHAGDGDRVLVAPGHYEEDGLVVPQGVTLWGAGPAYTELWADGNGPSITLAGDGTVFGIWINGGDPAIVADVTDASVWIDSVWIGSAVRTLEAHTSGPCEITVARSVVWSEDVGAVLEYSADSEVRLHNTHWLGNGGDFHLRLAPSGNGGDTVTNTLVHNSIFEHGQDALDLSMQALDGGHSVLVYNNVFVANHLGAGVKCSPTPDLSFELSLFNNWFVDHSTGVDLSQCGDQAIGFEIYNGYWGNTIDVLGPDNPADSSFTAPPQFVDALPNEHHDDDYRLQPGSAGIDAGLGVPSGPNEYMDNDGTIPDVGAYGGPYADEWNWDGDLVSEVDGDCDDRDPTRFPGAEEICDGADNDCNGVVEDEIDGDGDGFSICDGDCADGDPDVSPGAEEICDDGRDNDCDGMVDADDDDCQGDDDDAGDDDAGDDDAGDDDGAMDDDDHASGFRCECHLGGATPVSAGLPMALLLALLLARRLRR